MLSQELRREIYERFNIEECCINRPIHYRVPKNIGQHPYLTINNEKEKRIKKIIGKIHNNIKIYSRNKVKTINQLENKVQRKRIDILFNKTYDKINNKFRVYNNNFTPNKKLETINTYWKEKIKDNLINHINFYNNLFKKNNYKKKRDYLLEKQYIKSKILLEQKQIQDYNNIYKIKYIDILPFFPKTIFYDHKFKRDTDIPKINKLFSPSYSHKFLLFNKNFCTIKNKKSNLNKYKNENKYYSENKKINMI